MPALRQEDVTMSKLWMPKPVNCPHCNVEPGIRHKEGCGVLEAQLHWAICDAVRFGTKGDEGKQSFHSTAFLVKLRECGYDVTPLPEAHA
jgi:hypothetical protein